MCTECDRGVVALSLGWNFAISEIEVRHLCAASEKRAGPVISVVIVLSPKPVETNT